MALDFMGLFDSLGLFWRANKTDELSNDDGTLSHIQKPPDLEAETRQREKEQEMEVRRAQMRRTRQQCTNANSQNFRRR